MNLRIRNASDLIMLVAGFFAVSGAAEGAFPLFAVPDQPDVLAMAGATAPLAGGAGALFSNPAGLSSHGDPELYLSAGWLYEDMTRKTAAITLPVPAPERLANRVWFGTAVSSIDYGTMERRIGSSSQPLGQYDANDARVAVALSVHPWRSLRLGVGFNYFEARIAEYDASMGTLDVGVRYSLPRYDLEMGISASNLSTLTSSNVGGDAWQSYQAGIQWATFGSRFAPACTVRWGDGEDVEVLGGLQYDIANNLFLRAGRAFGHYSAGYAAGIGGRVHDLGINYSFEDYREGLGSVHRIGLTWKLS